MVKVKLKYVEDTLNFNLGATVSPHGAMQQLFCGKLIVVIIFQICDRHCGLFCVQDLSFFFFHFSFVCSLSLRIAHCVNCK